MFLRLMFMQRRLAGLLLLVSFLLLWGSAIAGLFLVDSKGTSIFLLPPQRRFTATTTYISLVQWLSMLQLISSGAAAVGMTLFTRILGTADRRGLPLLGLVTFLLSVVFWVIIEAFHLGTSVWVTQQGGKTGGAPVAYDFLFFWTEDVMNNISVTLTDLALACYGGTLLITPILPRWVGWMTLVYAGAGLGLAVLTGAAYIPPEFGYLPLGLFGVLLLL